VSRSNNLSHARWLTTAERLLRLYIGTDNPSSNLIEIVTFVIKVYCPVWFYIQYNPSCIQGPRHILRMLTMSRYLPEEFSNVIQNNGYFAHPENILLAMITDERGSIRF
jgi:hypothetical protein